jgi:hypothetical protein
MTTYYIARDPRNRDSILGTRASQRDCYSHSVEGRSWHGSYELAQKAASARASRRQWSPLIVRAEKVDAKEYRAILNGRKRPVPLAEQIETLKARMASALQGAERYRELDARRAAGELPHYGFKVEETAKWIAEHETRAANYAKRIATLERKAAKEALRAEISAYMDKACEEEEAAEIAARQG